MEKYRLKNLSHIIRRRRYNFEIYKKNLNSKYVFFPEERKEEFNTYHTFVVQVKKRNQLKSYLKKKGIDTTIHYPIPIHLQRAAKNLGYSKGTFPETESQAGKI